ncbi:MAG: alpha/beta fold hydrolase, partial [Gaiellaceae bacterium]
MLYGRPVAEAEAVLRHVSSADGTRIGYQRSGEGPPLVLVHGATGAHWSFRFLVPTLVDRFTVYALDRRGRGESGDRTEYAIEREFEDVAAVVDSLDESASVLGHSYGATVALGAALVARSGPRGESRGGVPLRPRALREARHTGAPPARRGEPRLGPRGNQPDSRHRAGRARRDSARSGACGDHDGARARRRRGCSLPEGVNEATRGPGDAARRVVALLRYLRSPTLRQVSTHRSRMSTADSIVVIDTSEIREGKVDELKTALTKLVEFVEANEAEP